MSNPDLAIMVVDDAKVSSLMISRTLVNAGYRNLRQVNDPKAALRSLEERPAALLVADWLMPGMDGLELSARVRQLDEANNHFTYIILLTAEEGVHALRHAFDNGVDDFIHKTAMQQQLLPRVFAAERMTEAHNRLLRENQMLVEANRRLNEGAVVDPLTGLGNRLYALRYIDDVLRHVDRRGGAMCYLQCALTDYDELKAKHSETVLEQVVVSVSRRLRQLVRPLDVVARIDDSQFAVITHQPDIDNCRTTCFRRIEERIKVRAYKTNTGFVPVNAAFAIVGVNASHRDLDAEGVMTLANRHLEKGIRTGNSPFVHWQGGR